MTLRAGNLGGFSLPKPRLVINASEEHAVKLIVCSILSTMLCCYFGYIAMVTKPLTLRYYTYNLSHTNQRLMTSMRNL